MTINLKQMAINKWFGKFIRMKKSINQDLNGH